jgi:hypothetical protein
LNCPACGHELPPAATFCAACRARGGASASPVQVRPISPGVTADNDPRERFFLIVACLFSAGPLAIPRLRKSKAFGPVGKLVLGGLAILQWVVIAALVVALFVYWRELMDWWLQLVRGELPRHR